MHEVHPPGPLGDDNTRHLNQRPLKNQQRRNASRPVPGWTACGADPSRSPGTHCNGNPLQSAFLMPRPQVQVVGGRLPYTATTLASLLWRSTWAGASSR